jgi:tetratricopeptide (TPR) repeat protein
MTRRPVLLALLAALAAPAAAAAQDRVDFLDRAKGQPTYRTGTIASEDPAKVVIISGINKAKIEIPTADITDVRYEVEPPEGAQARTAERLKQFDKALQLYKDAAAKLKPGNPYALAHLRFKAAKLTALQAEAGSATDRQVAIVELRRFLKDFPDSRHSIDALDTLSRLLLADGQSPQEVVDAFRALRTKYADRKEITSRCDLFESQLLVQEAENLLKDQPDAARKKYEEALQKFESMLKDADKATAMDIKINAAQCKAALGRHAEAIKDLEAILKEATDDRTRAAAYLGRGDCYRLNGQFREAMWDYLWVDVVYHQDREQTAKALYHLAEVFERLGDPERARQSRERLNKDYKDTRYQKLLKG